MRRDIQIKEEAAGMRACVVAWRESLRGGAFWLRGGGGRSASGGWWRLLPEASQPVLD